MPVAVRNLRKTLTTFNDPDAKLSVEWGVAGDQHGQDVQWVPEALLEHPKFLRAVALKILAIEPDQEEIAAAVQAQALRYHQEVESQDVALNALIDRGGGRELVLTEDDINAFIKSRDKGQPSTLDAAAIS